jgi:VWFA-related protein
MKLVRILVLALGALALQQPQQQQPTFKSRIDLVQVNVVAVDAAGKHIYGLKASDFTLLDRGKPQTISTFDEVDADHAPAEQTRLRLPATVRRDVASNHVNEVDRLVVLVIDDLHIYRGRSDKAKEVSRNVVSKLAPGGYMAVLFTSGDKSTEVTDDSSRLVAAVETLKARQSWRRPHPAIDAQTAIALDPEAGIENLDKVNQSQSVQVSDFFDNMNQYKTLDDAARMLRLSPARRKAFVMVTEGVGLNPLGVYEEPPGECNGPCYHHNALEAMMRSMRRSNVATFVLDPRGNVPTQKLLEENFPEPLGRGLVAKQDGRATDEDQAFRWNNPVRQAQDGLKYMAEASGGFAVTDDDDLAGGLTRIVEDLNHYYLLGFYPADTGGPQYRELQVKTSRPGLTLRFRRAYAEIGPPDPPKKGTDPLSALVTSALPSSNVPLRLHAIQVPSLAKETRVVFALELTVPKAPEARVTPKLDDIQYAVFIVDMKKGKVVQQFANTAQVSFKTEGLAERPPDSFRYQILTALNLPPGSYQVRASATSETLAAGGSVFLPLTVASSSGAFDVSDLALGYAEGPRLAFARDKTLTPEDSMRLPIEPSLDRVFSSAESVRLFASVVRREPGALTATITLRGADGKAALEQRVSLSPEDDVIDTTLAFKDLASGPYQLRVTVSNGSRKVERELGFAIR